MLDSRVRSLTILARLQAILGTGVVVILFALFAVAPTMLGNSALSLASIILGAAAAVYYFSLHQLFKKSKLALSTAILSVISLLNLMLVIAATGGLDSPFYSFWLLAIVIAGIFGLIETVAIVVLTSLYYLYNLISTTSATPHQTDHVIQFLITLAAAGLTQWIFGRGRRGSSGNGKLVSLSGQLTTEQLKAEAIMASIGEGVMVIDAARRIQLFNKAAQELTGWDESSAQNIDYNLVLQLKTSDDQPVNQFNDPFAESWKKGEEVVHKNLVAVTRGGRKVQLNLSISPIFNDKQQPTGAIALFRDISKEKEVERQRDEFVSTASHEMRTPVAAIEGYISLAMNPNVASIDDRAKKYLEKAHDTIGHLGELFRDLLNVTKAEEGQLGGKIEAVNLGKLVQSSVDDMQFTAQKHSLTLVYQIGSGTSTGKAIAPLYYVAANPERLREVVMNLIDNAIKFTSEGGVKVILEGDDKEVKISVNDTGVGIAPEDIGHLFQKFYRIDNSATRTIGGTGLGLYLCRRLIESFNGRIWAEGRAGEGSTFHFSLPRLTQTEIDRLDQQATAAPVTATAGAIVKPGQVTAAPATPSPTPPPAAAAPIVAPVSVSAAPVSTVAPVSTAATPVGSAANTIAASVAAAAAPQASAGPAVTPPAMPAPAAALNELPEAFTARHGIQ